MTKHRRPRPILPRQARRRRGVAVAFALSLLTLAQKCHDHDDAHKLGVGDGTWLSATAPPFLFCAAAASQAEAEPDEDALPRPLNYYEILGLETPDTHRRPRTGALHSRKKRTNARARITTDQIKKAYRKQAQLFHPDKASRNNMTIDEATSRFAGIAEAYKVLLDPAQRYEYDWDLLEDEDEYEEARVMMEEDRQERHRMERQQRGFAAGDSLYETVKNGAASFHAWKDSVDPWSVFEDFFFQDSSADQNQGESRYQARNPYEDTHHPHRGSMPPLVSETTIHRGYDPGYAADVYTVLRREEYLHDPNESGEIYYRIHGQDFVQNTRADPYTGFIMQEYYSAVTEPYLVEEGYARPDHADYSYAGDFRHGDDHYGQEKYHATQHRRSKSKVEEGEYIRPNTSGEEDPWISANGRYQVSLSSTCELSIVRLDDEAVLWSSDTYIPSTRADGCHLTMNSMGQLVLSVDYGSGVASIGNTVLWSTHLPPVVPHLFEDGDAKEQSATFRYYASLDDDGVIAVYRVRERVVGDTSNRKTQESGRNSHSTADQDFVPNAFHVGTQLKLKLRNAVDKLVIAYDQIAKSSAQLGQTKAALTWDHVRYNVGRVLSGRPWATSTVGEDQSYPETRHECIYSTSPSSCFAPGRNAIHVTKKIARSLKRSFQTIDSHLDSFVSSLTEPVSDYDYDDHIYGYNSHHDFESDYDEDEEDILDTLLRVTGAAGAAGAQLGKAGIHAANMGMKHGRKAAGKVVGKMKDRMGMQSTRWGERTAEDDEVNRFF